MKKTLFALTAVFLLACTYTTACSKHEKMVSHAVMSTGVHVQNKIVEYAKNSPDIQEKLPFYHEIAKNITSADRDILAKIVYLEARDQSYLGQKAVAEVIFNRILSDEFPDTVEKVIFQKNQFTPAYRIPYTTPTQEQYDAVDEVLSEIYTVLDAGVVFFSMGQYNKYLYEKIGDHYFCYSKKSYEMKKGY